MKRKNLIYILVCGALLTSCSDYLETPPSAELDENKVFADRTLTESYLTGVYAEGMPLGFSMNSSDADRKLAASSTLASACDEAEEGAEWGKGNSSWNKDNHNNNSIDWDEDPHHTMRWETLRKCNILLERLHEVPLDQGDPEFNTRATGEAYFMRALVFWEGVYRYGGLPIVRRRLNASDVTTLPRNTFADCVDSIVADCDRAAKLLPNYYTDATKKGRANRVAALSLKARVLLYAASPLFNTNHPYLSLGPLAADLPSWANNQSWSDGGLFATFNFVKFYETKTGQKAAWKDNGGDDLLDIYESLDPRFKQTIAAHGAFWNDEVGVLNFFPGGAHSVANDKTKHLVRKWVPRTLKVTPPLNTVNIDWIVFRVAELYLNYAEALNEYYDNPPAEAFQAVNLVRARSGMPAFDNALTKDEFRQKLRNERAVELAYEDHRFWDIRRWMIAENEGVMQGKMYGLKLSPIVGQPNKAHYVPYVFERRSWSRRSYLHPIKQIEIDKGYLKQNPGW